MPTYDYQCDSCGHTFEAMQSMKDAPLSVCPECANAALRRLISGGAGVIFRGSGFYVNDSRKSSSTESSTPAQKSTGESSSSGTDTAKKTDSSNKANNSKKSA